MLTHVCLPDQIPRYILTLHELLAHTPHEHVERTSLDYAKPKLEELSRYNITPLLQIESAVQSKSWSADLLKYSKAIVCLYSSN